MNLDLNYYISVFIRRIYIIVISTVGVTAAAVYFAFALPPTYSAQARLLVESPQIPTTLAASTVETDAVEQLQIIEQRLMTRENLLEIARAFNVFASRPNLTADEIVKEMREQTQIRRSGGQRSEATLMTIEFTSDKAQTTAQVVNEYLTRVLAANRDIRTGLAEQTLDFFEQEVERLGAELSRRSDRIVSYKSENADALPTSVEFRQSRQASLQERLVQIQRELQSLEDQKQRLIEVFDSGGQIASKEELSPEAQRLAQLRDDLDTALAVYSPSNPRVRMLEAQIRQAEAKLENVSAIVSEVEEAPTDPRENVLNLQLAEIDARQDYLVEQQGMIETELENLTRSLSRTPEVSVNIDALQRDYDNIQQQYNVAVDRLAKAATGERIELLSKGERISVIEQATVPSEPSSPNRPLIAGAGAFFGMGLGAAAILALEFLNQSIRRPVDIERRLGVTPIATLPYFRTRRETLWKRAVIILLIAAVVVGGPAILWAVHTYFMPLDLLTETIANRVLR